MSEDENPVCVLKTENAVAAVNHNHYEESLSMLRHTNGSKSIQNRPPITEDPKDPLLREDQEEIRKSWALIFGQLDTVNLSGIAIGHWVPTLYKSTGLVSHKILPLDTSKGIAIGH
ncbi:hypothetical protein F2P81_025549 [Scophthalmus maximus]|uniref:Uncharacterized protein n=1 Tax=Scophthalmus maximus TaxID=52904 RepID=A0A6A4RS64_SCOMX|nr:hypothetical protein F2P81_025549 [Scophthalmus maximus]